MNLKEYANFVNERWAPSPTPLPEIEWRWHVAHASLGISGEALEIVTGICFAGQGPNSEYITKELGDLLFYTVKAAHLFNLNLTSINKTLDEVTSPCVLDAEQIITYAEKVADKLKKVAIYAQNHSSLIADIREGIYELLYTIHLAHPLGSLTENNANKLRARYKEKFTTEESITRNDE